MSFTKNFVIFIGHNFQSRATVRLDCTRRKKNTVSAREGKVSLLRRGGQSQGCALTYGACSPQATKTWPRVTENIVQVTQPGDMLVLVS